MVEGHSLEEIRSAHMMGRRHLLSTRRPELPAPFVRVVERALSADPSRLYTSAGPLIEELGTVLGEPSRQARP